VPGPADDAGGLTLAETLPNEIEAGQGVLKKKVRLFTDGNPLELAPDQVEVSFAVGAARFVKEFVQIESAVKNSGGEYKISLSSVYLLLSRPGDVVKKWQSAAIGFS